MPAPDLDYAATSVRLPWTDVPGHAVSALESAVGARVCSAAPPVGSGFGGAYAGRVTLADGRDLFVKAAPPSLEFPAAALVRESEILRQLPAHVPRAALAGQVSVDGWELLALDFVSGRMPGNPWTATDLGIAYAACEQSTREPAPKPLDQEDQFSKDPASDPRIAVTCQQLSARTHAARSPYGRSTELEALVHSHGPDLVALLEPLPEVVGDRLSHGDLRPDNILITEDSRALLLDWNWVCLGPAWLDFVGLLPMAHRQGLDVQPWLASPLVADADPRHVDAFLAAVAVYMLSNLEMEPMVGCQPEVRRHQVLFAHDFVTFLAHRHSW